MDAAIDARGCLVTAALASRQRHRCPGCRGSVVLRRGSKRAAHFAHKSPVADATCPFFNSIPGGSGVLYLSADWKWLIDHEGRRMALSSPCLFRWGNGAWYALRAGEAVVPAGRYLLYSPTTSPQLAGALHRRDGFWLIALPEVISPELQALLSAHQLTIYHPSIGIEASRRRCRLGEPVILTIVTTGLLEPDERHFELQVRLDNWATTYSRVDYVGLWPKFEFVAHRPGTYLIQDPTDRVRPLLVDVERGADTSGDRHFDLVQAA